MFQIQIPDPCNEDWDKMTPSKKGAFCKVCSKEVFDFTKSTHSDIKKTLIDSVHPCVRILKSQMDEMNFLEWFRSLFLKQKIKYLFLFAFIIAGQNMQAQEEFSQKIELLDSLNILDIDTASYEELSIFEEIPEIPLCSIPEPIPLSNEVIMAGSIAVPIVEAEYSNNIETVYGGTLIHFPDPTPNYEIEFQDRIELTDGIFSFTTIDDTLIFHSVVPQKTLIYLSIEQDRLGKKPYPPYNEIFKSPITIEAGEKLMKIPIGDHVHGSYTIKIKSKKGEGIARIMYL